MFDPQSEFHLTGEVFSMGIKVRIEVAPLAPVVATAAEGASIVDVQNIQTMLISALTKTLAQLERIEESGVNPFRQPAQAPPVMVMPHLNTTLDNVAKGEGD